jgi:phage terminase large subunit-like protein
MALEFYADVLHDAEQSGTTLAVMNELGRRDLFFLLTRLLHRKDINRDFLFDRCAEVQDEPNGMLDLWAREHYKSTIITFGKSIQDTLDSHSEDSFYWDQETTIGIFSHTKSIAKAFLSQIMQELEQNDLLKDVYPDVLWRNPRKEAPKWSLDQGIVVKRKTNPKEASVEAHGLTDGQPTGKHFLILNYDDVVTRESVYTPEQIKKTTDAWELSTNLGAEGGVDRYIGTRYHFNDTWRAIMERKAAEPRIHAATDNGKANGNPVFLTRKALDDKRRKQGPYTFACQQLMNPKAEDAMGFQEHWIRYYDAAPYLRGEKIWPANWNYYLLCDPAGEKKSDNDYTVMVVIGLGPDKNYYLCAGIRDRLNLSERTDKMFELHGKFNIAQVGYEKYGKDSDIEHIEYVMEQRNYRFDILPLGGPMPKNDRIRRLVPLFSDKRFFIPYELLFVDYEGKTQDFIKAFINDEYLPFPVAVHDDMLDCKARIKDPKLGAVFPKAPVVVSVPERKYNPLTYMQRGA